MAFCACCSPVFNNGFWGFKLFLWVLLVIGSIFLSNDVVGTDGYVWPARIGAFVFIIMQQLVLIDLAYRYYNPAREGDMLRTVSTVFNVCLPVSVMSVGYK